MNATPHKAYHQASATIPKARQVVMLYEGAIRCLQQAAEAMRANLPETRFQKLNKATEILMALQSSLDFEVRGNAAHILNEFYATMIVEIMGLHRTQEPAICTRLVVELKEMRDMWEALDRGLQSGQITPAATAAVAIADPMNLSI